MSLLKTFVPARVVFPERDLCFEGFRQALQCLSRTDVLFWCARLNHLLTGSEWTKLRVQKFGILQFGTSREIALIEDYRRQQNIDPDDLTVFFRGQLLELMRWTVLLCADHPDDGVTFEDAEVRSQFFYVCMLAGELWGARIYTQAFHLEKDLDSARRLAIGPFRQGMEGSAKAGEWSHSFGRGYQLFTNYLPRQAPEFNLAFKAKTGFSVDDYWRCWAALLTNYAPRHDEAKIFDAGTLGKSTLAPTLLQRFIASESQSPEDLYRSMSADATLLDSPSKASVPILLQKALRERPILRASDGRSIIMDPIFALDKFSIGPLFHALNVKNANRLFVAFGKAFEYYTVDVLQRMFPGADSIASPLKHSVTGRDSRGDFEIDAGLNYVGDLVLFEIKAVWVREEHLPASHADDLLAHLRKQYGIVGDSRKGAGQLARVVNALASRDCGGQAAAYGRARRIFPLLVIHDSAMAVPGFGAFIAEEFRSALVSHEMRRDGTLQVCHLEVVLPIVLTIDDLEMLEVSIEHRGLRDFLSGYDAWSPDRFMSFHNYLATLSQHGNANVYANRALAASACELLESAMLLFRNPPCNEE